MRGLRSKAESGIVSRVSGYGFPHCPYCGARVLRHGNVCGNCKDAAVNDPQVIARTLRRESTPRVQP